jgi:hypothetical protein
MLHETALFRLEHWSYAAALHHCPTCASTVPKELSCPEGRGAKGDRTMLACSRSRGSGKEATMLATVCRGGAAGTKDQHMPGYTAHLQRTTQHLEGSTLCPGIHGNQGQLGLRVQRRSLVLMHSLPSALPYSGASFATCSPPLGSHPGTWAHWSPAGPLTPGVLPHAAAWTAPPPPAYATPASGAGVVKFRLSPFSKQINVQSALLLTSLMLQGRRLPAYLQVE